MSATSTLAKTITLPMPHAGQRVVRRQARRFNHLCAGRRWRKSTLGMSVIVEAALAKYGEYGWTAPSYKQVRIGWDEMRRACHEAVTFNETRMEARFPNGSRVRFASLSDPDLVRGWTLDGLLMDEASECPERAFYEVLRPMLLDTGGWTWFLYTPKGRNWTWREWAIANTGERPDTVAWQIPTLGARIENGALIRHPHPLENPEIDWSEMLHMFQTTPERTFRQEILAEFLDDGGGVIRHIDDCLRDGLQLLKSPPKHDRRYVIGLDLAKSVDFTALIVADELSHEIVHVERWQHDPWPLQKARIALTARLWHNALVFVDSTGVGDAIYDDLRQFGLRVEPFHFTAASKEALVENAVVMTEQQGVTLPRLGTEQLVNELKALEYTRLPSGRDRVAAPDGMHDDLAMAFFLCLWGLKFGGGGGMPHTAGFSWDMLVEKQTEIGGVGLLRKGIF